MNEKGDVNGDGKRNIDGKRNGGIENTNMKLEILVGTEFL